MVPRGLKRYKDGVKNRHINLKQIVVGSEYDKEQLLKAFQYIHWLKDLDTDFIGANVIAHLYRHPDLIVVDKKMKSFNWELNNNAKI